MKTSGAGRHKTFLAYSALLHNCILPCADIVYPLTLWLIKSPVDLVRLYAPQFCWVAITACAACSLPCGFMQGDPNQFDPSLTEFVIVNIGSNIWEQKYLLMFDRLQRLSHTFFFAFVFSLTHFGKCINFMVKFSIF